VQVRANLSCRGVPCRPTGFSLLPYHFPYQSRRRRTRRYGGGWGTVWLTANVLETVLEVETNEHLGYEKHQFEGREGGDSRNGRRAKTVLTEIDPAQIQVPRDTDASVDPQIVKKRQRRLRGVEEIVLSLSAKGLTAGEIAAHVDDVYGASVSQDTISGITDKVLADMAEWAGRPRDPVYPVMFIDAIHVKVRDGQVTNRPGLGSHRCERRRSSRHPRVVGRRRRRRWRSSGSPC
jgi:Transposase, Mutator family